MGKLNFHRKMTTGAEIFIVLLIVGLAAGAVAFFAPGLSVEESKVADGLVLNQDFLNNVTPEEELPLPSDVPSIKAAQQSPAVVIGGYAWNGQTAIIHANGGKKTTKGSLMEANGVNLTIERQDWLSELKAMQLEFIEQYDKGNKYPSGRAAMGIMIMGDGVPFYLSTMQTALNEKYNGKYHVEAIGCVGGMSNGEDKLIGPVKWKNNPQTMRGALISTVPGDGDWVTTLNYCFANNIPVNPDFTTYDENAVNIYPSENDDYINSAKELIKSQTQGFKVELKKIVDGKITGETIQKEIDGCATWTPGDKMVFDALQGKGFVDVASTADFPNQMATTLVIVKEWGEENPNIIKGILKASLTSANQIKQHDSWARDASNSVASVFGSEPADYWYNMFKGQTETSGGVTYNIGGTRALNYADVAQYYGLGRDGINRYEGVYNQVSNYLVEMNPFGFNENVDGVVPFSEGVNDRYLREIADEMTKFTAKEEERNYTETKTNVLAKGQWHINFALNEATIEPSSFSEINKIYGLLTQAEQAKVTIVGHTDNTGSDAINVPLSERRAESVAEALMLKGLKVERIQGVVGKGSREPVSPTASNAENRRVEITILQ